MGHHIINMELKQRRRAPRFWRGSWSWLAQPGSRLQRLWRLPSLRLAIHVVTHNSRRPTHWVFGVVLF